jgi:dienelactone hydrolase
VHWLDRLFAQALRYPQMYSEGWGDESVFEQAQDGLLGLRAAAIDPQFDVEVAHGALVRRDLTFRSPVADELPPDVGTAHARLWSRGPFTSDRPCVVVLAGSGGAGYARREAWMLPLVQHGVQALLLENPYYGRRAPTGQRGSRLRTFADQLRMNRATLAEALALLEWLRPRVCRVGVTGFSMGGHMAALTAAGSTEPVRCAALAAGRSPVPIYTTGALSTSIAWRTLGEQLGTDPRARVGQLLAAATATVPVPHPDSRLIIVAARRDGFVEAEQARALQASWPGSELRWLPGGHITAVARHARALRGAVLDSLN